MGPVLFLRIFNTLSVCLSVYLPACLSVCLSGYTWTFAVDTITFKGVSGSKQNLVGLFYVWNVGRVLKSKVKSWSWSWSWSWTGFWFWQKVCRTTPKSVGIFRTRSITFFNEFNIEILILILKKKIWTNFVEKNWISWACKT